MSARGRAGRILTWALAIVALAFVAWVVPVRDRCWDPRSPESTRVSVSRDDGGCILHVRTGDVRIPAADCAALRCEPGVASTLSHARIGVLAALMGLYMFGMLMWAARWRMLLSFAGVDMSVMQLWRVSIEAQAGGILLRADDQRHAGHELRKVHLWNCLVLQAEVLYVGHDPYD